ncbi:alpha/beta hydrolase fold domain-containing protein [Propionicicella superfundia]|uniref:alpha/beta hydrolase fold domain-containing protein n=1 Tax=Propionicicella superfundia TaxID=348582 RepID=UPI0004165FEE|nr:alpha/beta hydrolase fold domain-containing protein [Propionicicella superfundia]
MSAPDEPNLVALLAAVRAEQGAVPLPPRFVRAPHEPLAAWRAEIAQARTIADARAVQHRDIVDRMSARLFGATLADVLPEPEVELLRTAFSVPVPSGAQLADLVPSLAGTAPRGPAPRSTAEVRSEVRVRVTATRTARRLVIRLHGGAFWMGGGPVAERVDARLVSHIATTTDAAVLDIDHRLAPEHPYPAAVVDTLCVLDAVRAGHARIDADPRSLVLLGSSSGANIATLAARADALREPDAPLAGLALVVPSVLLSEAPPALKDDPDAWASRLDQLRGYLGLDIDPHDPWVSPAAEPELSGMPPTFAAVAEYDEIAVGGTQLCAAIAAGGSFAEARIYPMTHTTATPETEASVIRDTAAFLRDRLDAAPER